VDILKIPKEIPDDVVNRMIEQQEAKWPRLVHANKQIREFSKTDRGQRFFSENPSIDLRAALVSDCCSDTLNCGRCAFISALRKWGVANPPPQ
jgi:hypothetical protein